jgi:hypothetical protein
VVTLASGIQTMKCLHTSLCLVLPGKSQGWSIYDFLAKSGNSEAKYNASYNLICGPPYCPHKYLAKAESYIREAANDGLVESHYCYYQLLFKKVKSQRNLHPEKKKKSQFASSEKYELAIQVIFCVRYTHALIIHSKISDFTSVYTRINSDTRDVLFLERN